MMAVLIGETYLHTPTGRLLVVVDYESKPRGRSRVPRRTHRVVVRELTGATWVLFPVRRRELEDRPPAGVTVRAWRGCAPPSLLPRLTPAPAR